VVGARANVSLDRRTHILDELQKIEAMATSMGLPYTSLMLDFIGRAAR
jgi:hypothetical protein